MIEVTYSNNRISIKGHADSEVKGKDLVCAAVSSLIISVTNSLTGFNKNEIRSKSGEVTINSKHKISKEDQIRLEVLLNGLKLIAKKYPKYIKIKKEK